MHVQDKKLAKKRLLAIFMHKPNQLCLKLGIALVVYALLFDVIYFKKLAKVVNDLIKIVDILLYVQTAPH